MKVSRFLCFFLLCSACLAPLHAAPSGWPTQRYQYIAEGKPLREVLRDFASSQGMAISMSSDIEGVVSGKFDFAPARFIDLMAKSYGFSWYFDGVVLHIASAQDMQTRVIRLTSATTSEFREMVSRLGLAQARFPVQYDEATNTAIVQGPSPYVALVVEMGSRLEARSVRRGAAQTRIFMLKNAYAADRGDDELPLRKGVATLLRELYVPAGAGFDASPSGKNFRDSITRAIGTEPQEPIAGLIPSTQKTQQGAASRPAGLGWLGGLGGRSDAGEAGGSAPNLKAASMRGADPSDESNAAPPLITADESSNAVIIRDLPERMPGYEAVIRQLDVAAERVEIEVQIIEVNNDAMDELGVDWRARSRRIGVQSGNTTALPSDFEGLSMSAVLGSARHQLLARINALTAQGRARVVAKPKVATLNNQVAVMSSQQKLHVKVEAYQSAQLYAITAGTDLKVRPSASLQNGEWKIRLDVNVQDGRVLDDSVGGIPVVTSNRIDTQAVVSDGESLLLAGYTLEEDKRVKGGVPGLSAVPGIGRLFSNERVERRNVVRLFMVSPRLLP